MSLIRTSPTSEAHLATADPKGTTEDPDEGHHLVPLVRSCGPTEPNPVKILTKTITLCLPRDPVAPDAGRSAAPAPAAAASPGSRSHATETESGREESRQRPRGASAGAQETEKAAARNPARPKRRQATEKAGVERRRRNVGRKVAALLVLGWGS
ncbi:hypothetical protein E2562_024717 [Oryza meyeriana var. granulata]|uniref:Uncharacterized protein n=1 Tax=Oryza meyeriana var. granulata TaxID=110450 RepID=A0A6G1D958_9ORYZ|nr:hypothetical protein E2562_024717 [Oryza meyeriana var. granulata]